MKGGFQILLGGPDAEDDGEVDHDREAAKAAMRRFRAAKDDDEALEALMAVSRYAGTSSKSQGGEEGEPT